MENGTLPEYEDVDASPYRWCEHKLDYEVFILNNSETHFILYRMEDEEGHVREGFLTPGGDQFTVHVCGGGKWTFNQEDLAERYLGEDKEWPLSPDTKIRMIAYLYASPVRFRIWYENLAGQELMSPRWMGIEGAEFPVGEGQVVGIAFKE
ncbi:hypothetical protein ACFL21_03515 [Patescibacteria group bacterium]